MNPGYQISQAIDETEWISLRLAPDRREVSLGFEVQVLPEPAERSLWITLRGVSRVFATHLLGNDQGDLADLQPVALNQLEGLVESFGRSTVYGDLVTADPSEFIGLPRSLDVRWAGAEPRLWLCLGKEGNRARLRLRVGFEEATFSPLPK